MDNQKMKMAFVGSRGLDDERATVMMTMARGAQASGFDVTLFLVASGADLVRKGAVANVCMNPLDPPMQELLDKFQEDGGHIMVCPPCAKVRGYGEDDLIDGAQIVGSPALHALIKEGAKTLCF
jgi:predicted peroxiredoxin